MTALGPGAATASQLLRIDDGGTAPEGVSPANLAVTGFGKGALSALQLLRANSGGTALEGVSPSLAVTGFGVSGLSALQLLRVNSGGTALEGYVLDARLRPEIQKQHLHGRRRRRRDAAAPDRDLTLASGRRDPDRWLVGVSEQRGRRHHHPGPERVRNHRRHDQLRHVPAMPGWCSAPARRCFRSCWRCFIGSFPAAAPSPSPRLSAVFRAAVGRRWRR